MNNGFIYQMQETSIIYHCFLFADWKVNKNKRLNLSDSLIYDFLPCVVYNLSAKTVASLHTCLKKKLAT